MHLDLHVILQSHLQFRKTVSIQHRIYNSMAPISVKYKMWIHRKNSCTRMELILSRTKDFFFQIERVSVYDNFKFGINGRKFSKRVENAAGKGEIARNEQFLLFPQCF